MTIAYSICICLPWKIQLLSGHTKLHNSQLKYLPARQSTFLQYCKYPAYRVTMMSKVILTSAFSYLLLYFKLHAAFLTYTLYSLAKHIKKKKIATFLFEKGFATALVDECICIESERTGSGCEGNPQYLVLSLPFPLCLYLSGAGSISSYISTTVHQGPWKSSVMDN